VRRHLGVVPQLVQTDTDVGVGPRFCNPCASSVLTTACQDAAEIAQGSSLVGTAATRSKAVMCCST
jgi:hypothetical protein